MRLVLKKDIEDRPEVSHFLESVAADFSRLTESSPLIPTSVVSNFKYYHKEWIGDKRHQAHYLNGLHPIEVGEEVEEAAVPLAV